MIDLNAPASRVPLSKFVAFSANSAKRHSSGFTQRTATGAAPSEETK